MREVLTKHEALRHLNGCTLIGLEVSEAVDGENIWGELGNQIPNFLEEEVLVPLCRGFELVLSFTSQISDQNDISLLFGLSSVFGFKTGAEISFKRGPCAF